MMIIKINVEENKGIPRKYSKTEKRSYMKVVGICERDVSDRASMGDCM